MYLKILRQNILAALKQNLLPGVCLQIIAISIALCYFYWPDSHTVFNLFAQLKAEHGWRYALISTALFGGFIPFVYLWLTGQVHTPILKTVIFLCLFWGYKGIEVDLLYTAQGFWFGNETNFSTIAKKTLFDQLVYSALWAAPSITIAYLWKDNHFNFSKWKQEINRSLFVFKIPTLVVSNWLIWFPAVSVIYAMPAPLQIPLFNLVLCFFVLLVAAISKKHTAIH